MYMYVSIQTILVSGNTNRWVMIDGTDAAQEGIWLDANGSGLQVVTWALGEPNGGTSENCLYIAEPLGSYFADLGCTGNILCKISI